MKARTPGKGAFSADQHSRRGGIVKSGRQSHGKSAPVTKGSRKASHLNRTESQDSINEDDKWKDSFYDEKPSKTYYLDFHGKKVTKINRIQNFPNCKTADFSCNKIQKIENLDGNSEICELKLYSNELTKIEGLGKLRKLQTLQLQHNQIKVIGDGLKDLRSLKVLNLASNSLSSIAMQEIKHCSNLTFLDLSYNCIKSIEFLSAIPYVEELYLAGNQLEKCPDASCCKKVHEIDLSNNRLRALSGLKNLPNLTVLNVSNNRLEDLKSLGTLRSIQRIDASRNAISMLAHITHHFPNLEVLAVPHNVIDQWEELLHLRKLKELKELYFDGNPVKEDIESSRMATWSHKVAEILPDLEILDGHHLGNVHLKTGDRHIMRPMTASQGLSTKMVKDQIKVISHELSFYQDMITTRFNAMNGLLDSLPSKPITTLDDRKPPQESASTKGQEKRPSISDLDARPTSRCRSRARIEAALEFASQQIENDTKINPSQNSFSHDTDESKN